MTDVDAQPGSVDERLVEFAFREHPSAAAKELREVLRHPECGLAEAKQVVAHFSDIENDYALLSVVATGLEAEDPQVRGHFARTIGMVAHRCVDDAYELLRQASLDERHPDPDLVRIGLAAVRADTQSRKAFDYIVEKGLRPLKHEHKPGAMARRQRVNGRFRTALEGLTHR